MPELPEVETVRRQLTPRLINQRVLDVLAATHPRFQAAHAAKDRIVSTVGRRGKYLIVTLRDPQGSGHAKELIVHLGMTGQLLWLPVEQDPGTHAHAGLVFADGVLWMRDPRRFGRIELVDPGRYESLPTLAALGPEPDDSSFTPAHVQRFMTRQGGPVKARLLAQQMVAGVGNYIADESLWRARIHPLATRLDANACRRLHRAIRKVVEESLNAGGMTERDYRHLDGSHGAFARYLAVHGRAYQPCRRCTATLSYGRVAGRGTVWCPHCQRR
jgi:formamidopyrimidine-DNA glycosylase